METMRKEVDISNSKSDQKAYQPPVVDKLQKLAAVTGVASGVSGNNDG